MSEEDAEAGRFLELAERIVRREPSLSLLQAGLLAAIGLDVAHDSRTFARKLGVAHAPVLRELNGLAERGDLIRIERRDARTMRSHYVAGSEGGRLLDACLPERPKSA